MTDADVDKTTVSVLRKCKRMWIGTKNNLHSYHVASFHHFPTLLKTNTILRRMQYPY